MELQRDANCIRKHKIQSVARNKDCHVFHCWVSTEYSQAAVEGQEAMATPFPKPKPVFGKQSKRAGSVPCAAVSAGLNK